MGVLQNYLTAKRSGNPIAKYSLWHLTSLCPVWGEGCARITWPGFSPDFTAHRLEYDEFSLNLVSATYQFYFIRQVTENC